MFATFRLAGSLPRHRLPPSFGGGARFAWLDRHDDVASAGPRWLAEPAIADCVVNSLRRAERDLGLCRVHAYVVMANHAHLLFSPLADASRVMQLVKGSSALQANRLLGRRGQPFWQHESYDHLARQAGEVDRIWRYIELNPVRAGLVAQAADWPWSSAGERQ